MTDSWSSSPNVLSELFSEHLTLGFDKLGYSKLCISRSFLDQSAAYSIIQDLFVQSSLTICLRSDSYCCCYCCHLCCSHFHYSPTVDDTLRCLTDTYRCQGRLEDAAELERLTKENKFDKAHKDRITQIFGDESFSEKLLADSSNSQISSKTQVSKNVT